MSISEKFKRALKGNDEEYDDELENDFTEEDEEEIIASRPAKKASQRSQTVSADTKEKGPTQTPASTSISSIQMKIVNPENKYEKATEVADHLMNKSTVFLNLEDTDKEVTRRILDFLTGFSYAIDGKIKRSSNFTYIITCRNVEVSGASEQNDFDDESDETDSNQVF